MITPVSRQAYQAEYDFLDIALQSERGAQRIFHGDGSYRDPARGQARQFLTRLNKARDYDRQMSMKIYAPDHPQYGQTEYAKLYIPAPNYDVKRGAWILQVLRNTIEGMMIEEIPPREEQVVDEEEFERRI